MNRRGRFAPTPSGLLHIGNAFTALAAWLQMRQVSGEFVLRIEDIDKARSRSAYSEQLLDDLLWLGIDWDEGPRNSGPFAPYEQSLRETLYEEALDRLQQDGRLYPCYCSRSELASIGIAPHGIESEGSAYPGICRYLTDEQRQAHPAKKPPALRFIMPNQSFSFQDTLIKKQHTYESVSDFVVKRADGMYSYQLAVTVDDAAMGITDVLRGNDLIDSTPRQLALYEALGLQAPIFAHVPLLVDESGERLSKRDSSLTLASMRSKGIPPEKLLGTLAYLAGWIDRPDPIPAAELVPLFGPILVEYDRIIINSQFRSFIASH